MPAPPGVEEHRRWLGPRSCSVSERRGPKSTETYARRAPSIGVAGPGFDSRQLHSLPDLETHQTRVMTSPSGWPPRADRRGWATGPAATKGSGQRVPSTTPSHEPWRIDAMQHRTPPSLLGGVFVVSGPTVDDPQRVVIDVHHE